MKNKTPREWENNENLAIMNFILKKLRKAFSQNEENVEIVLRNQGRTVLDTYALPKHIKLSEIISYELIDIKSTEKIVSIIYEMSLVNEAKIFEKMDENKNKKIQNFDLEIKEVK